VKEVHPDKQSATPKIVIGERLGDLGSRIQDAIAQRAYELFEARGYQHGQDMDDWFRAESELLHPVKVNVWASDREVLVTAEIPGFEAQEVEIAVERRQIILWARPDPRPAPAGAYPRRAPVALYHRLDLPSEINPTKASAKLTDGLLKLVLPKVAR